MVQRPGSSEAVPAPCQVAKVRKSTMRTTTAGRSVKRILRKLTKLAQKVRTLEPEDWPKDGCRPKLSRKNQGIANLLWMRRLFLHTHHTSTMAVVWSGSASTTDIGRVLEDGRWCIYNVDILNTDFLASI